MGRENAFPTMIACGTARAERYAFAQVGIVLEEALDIQKVFAALGGTACVFAHGPDLALKHVFNAGCSRKVLWRQLQRERLEEKPERRGDPQEGS